MSSVIIAMLSPLACIGIAAVAFVLHFEYWKTTRTRPPAKPAHCPCCLCPDPCCATS